MVNPGRRGVCQIGDISGNYLGIVVFTSTADYAVFLYASQHIHQADKKVYIDVV